MSPGHAEALDCLKALVMKFKGNSAELERARALLARYGVLQVEASQPLEHDRPKGEATKARLLQALESYYRAPQNPHTESLRRAQSASAIAAYFHRNELFPELTERTLQVYIARLRAAN